jgi:hypothetical protein
MYIYTHNLYIYIFNKSEVREIPCFTSIAIRHISVVFSPWHQVGYERGVWDGDKFNQHCQWHAAPQKPIYLAPFK